MAQRRLNNTSRISFTFVPGLEFITALYRTANRELFEETYADHHVSQDEAVVILLTDLRERLTPFMRRELDFFFKLEHSHADQAFHQLMFVPEAPQTVAELLNIVEETNPWELLQYLIEDRTEEETKESLLKLLEASHGMEDPNLTDWIRCTENMAVGSRVMEGVSSPEETKTRFLSLLRSFYQRGYAHVEDDITAQSAQAVSRFEEICNSDPTAFFHNYIGLDLALFDKETHIHVSLLTQYGSFVSVTKSPAVPHSIRLGINIEQAVNRTSDIELVDKFCKAISDKNRLEILRLLSNRPWYGQELAKRLELSPAAISYHMGFFYSVNLISLKRADQKGYFVLDKDRLQFLFGLLEQTLHLK